jgi:hypothetical protein
MDEVESCPWIHSIIMGGFGEDVDVIVVVAYKMQATNISRN